MLRPIKAFFVHDVQHHLEDMDEQPALSDHDKQVIDYALKYGVGPYDTACQIEFNRAMIATGQ